MNGDALAVELVSRALKVVLEEELPDWDGLLEQVTLRITALDRRIDDERRRAEALASLDRSSGRPR